MALLAIILFVLLLCLIIKGVQDTDDRNPAAIGKTGESEVSFVLHSLPEDFLVLDDVIIPDQVADPNKKSRSGDRKF